jgi:hypothetical protein
VFFHDGDEHINRDGNPDLGFYSILTCAVERLYSKMLLDPLEEQFYLPTAAIKLCDNQGRDDEVVCQELKPSFRFVIEESDSSQFVGILL